MTANPTSDQLAAQTHAAIAKHNPACRCAVITVPEDLAIEMAERFPDTNPTLIGEIMLHTMAKAQDLTMAFLANGKGRGKAATSAMNLTALTGANLYTGRTETSGT